LCRGNISYYQRISKNINNLHFMCGDAMKFYNNRNNITNNSLLKLENVDILINVEASHCYPSRELFIDQCYKA